MSWQFFARSALHANAALRSFLWIRGIRLQRFVRYTFWRTQHIKLLKGSLVPTFMSYHACLLSSGTNLEFECTHLQRTL